MPLSPQSYSRSIMKYAMSSDRFQLALFSLCFLLLTGVLFWKNTSVMQPLAGEAWWTLAFVEPTQASNPSFRLQNFSPSTQFEYRLISGGQTVNTGAVTVPAGGEYIVSLPPLTSPERLIIEVVHQGHTQTLQR